MKTVEIRRKFLEFFRNKDHKIVESSSLVPSKDPTLLFTNAGMVQFKDVFLGKEKRSYVRATSSQKCVRAGGKHNDLENVGFTARHHTFFEMLGNFSFGDYFKKEAIAFAWEFVTKVLGLKKDQLYVTVFEKDDEAAEIWRDQENVSSDRIFRLGEKDNFWQMGDTGPCGPCSEIYVDRGESYCQKQGKKDPGCKVGCDCDRYMEIWNLVFMQFNRDEKGVLHPLPKPSVDTGAGLERMASVLQNVDTNYEIDFFKEIIDETSKLVKQVYDPNDVRLAPSFRVIADHARCAAFLIADGVLPANEGRGYVLRRILRRAMRHGRLLGMHEPFLYHVCGYVINQMKDAYPDLETQRTLIERCVHAEEEQFLRTLETGMFLLDTETEKLKKLGSQMLPGQVAFQLYDTYGFPFDLTRTICAERNFEVDEPGFQKAMEDQKQRSRDNWKGSGDAAIEDLYRSIHDRLKDDAKLPEFVGYESLVVESECVGIITQHKEFAEVVFLKTPFYGESGGQIGDRGSISGVGLKAEVVDVQRPLSDLIVIKAKLIEGEFKEGKVYKQIVSAELRQLTACNHTATHLLHWALRQQLGTHVKQSGSMVGPESLRFDFTHFQALTKEELKGIEEMINDKIWNSTEVTTRLLPKDAAIAAGAIAMFGEKYSDIVRVISVGDYSVELCGGTHVSKSADINLFKIASETGIASGVRRIVAYTSKGAFRFLNERFEESKYVRDRLKVHSLAEIEHKLDRMQAIEKELKRNISHLKSQNIGGEVESILASAKLVDGVTVIVKQIDNDDDGMKTLRSLGERLRQKIPTAVVVLGMSQPEEGKVFLLAASGDLVMKRLEAGRIIKEIAPLVDGRGGGKADMAQAGGTKITALDEALKHADIFILKHLNGSPN